MESTWNCQFCHASYVTLRNLISHMRAVHSESVEDLGLTCQVNGCPMAFKRTNTWYRHVTTCHRQEYWGKHADAHAGDYSEEDLVTGGDNYMDTDDNAASDDDESSPTSVSTQLEDRSSTSVPSNMPPFISDQVIPGKLLKLRIQYLLSQAAVGEVVELVQTVCNNMATRVLSQIFESGEDLGLDLSSDFFKSLPEMFEEQSYPLASIENAYKQKSYISKKLPYVTPRWVEVRTHIGTIGRSMVPTYIPDGFFYVPLLESLEALLNVPSIFHQVMSGSHKSSNHLYDIRDGFLFEENSILRQTDQALQIIGYYDELTLTNPLMSRAKKYKIGESKYVPTTRKEWVYQVINTC